MRRIINILFFLAIIQYSKAQVLDTSSIIKNLKIKLFSEIDFGLLSNKTMEDYLKRDLKVVILKSKGFDNAIFLKINGQVLAKDSNAERTVEYITPPCYTQQCCFVYAYNKGKFYRLKGAKANDFKNLYNDMEYVWTDWNPVSKLNKKIINKYIGEYWIEGIDMECLLDSLIGKKGSCLDYFFTPSPVY